MMKTVVLSGGIPNPTSGGGALTAWSIVGSLLRAGHSVDVCVLENVSLSASSRKRNEKVQMLEALGARVTSIEVPVDGENEDGDNTSEERGLLTSLPSYRLRRAVRFASSMLDVKRPPLERYYPTVRYASQVTETLRSLSPDALFVYHFEPLAPIFKTQVAPTMVGVGDPSHLPAYHRWRLKNPFELSLRHIDDAVSRIKRARWQMGYMRQMMSRCAVAGAFAAHHAEEFRRSGLHDCRYLRTPIEDSAGASWASHRAAQHNEKPRLLMIGHLKGIATLSGLYFFAGEVLPLLEERLGPNAFEVHIVGGFDAPDDLSDLLDRPSVRFRGQIEPADDEFLASEILVVPTPIPLGIRVRILTGFSFGSCIVAHDANAEGIPEMKHRDNALLASTGPEMADLIVEALGDPSLRRRLSERARATYETYFSPDTAGRAIVDEIEGIVSA